MLQSTVNTLDAVAVLVETGRLHTAADLQLADTLDEELLNIKYQLNPRTSHEGFALWRENENDDLVFSVALACWFREWWNQKLDNHHARTWREEREQLSTVIGDPLIRGGECESPVSSGLVGSTSCFLPALLFAR